MRQNVSNRTFYSGFGVEMKLARSLHERDFMMKRCAFLLTLVVGIGFFQPLQALAVLPTTDVTCEVTHIGGESFTEGEEIGKEDCENSNVKFKVTGSNVSYTAETGPGCDSDNTEECHEVSSGEISSGSDTFELSVKDLLAEFDKTCDVAEQTIRVRIFYEDEYGDLQSEACTEIKVDTSGPDAPTNVRGEPGEHEISINWTPVSGITDYKVYYKVIDDCEDTVDAAEKAFQEAEAAFWEAWAALADNPDAQVIADAGTYDPDEVDPNYLIVTTFDDDESEKAQGGDHTLSDKAEPGEELLVRVTAIDDGGNESVFSEAICVEVIRTRGFCDSTDKCEDGCSVGPIGKEHAHATAGVVVGLISLFALVWARRRSRS